MLFSLVYKLAEQPPDIWHDPNAIGLMGIGIGIAAIFVAIAVGLYQVRQGRIHRKLVYETLSNVPLVSVNSAVADQVEVDVRVKGTLVKNARLLVLNIKNAGKASIHASDYFEPLTFEFDTKVLQASVLETTPPTLINPSTLPTFLTLTPQSVQFPSFNLNPGDTVQMSILLEGKGTLKVRGRLDEGTVVELELENRSPAISTVLIMAANVAVGVVLGAIFIWGEAALAPAAAVSAVGVGVGVVLLALQRILERKRTKQ